MNETVQTTWQIWCSGPFPGWLVAGATVLGAMLVCRLLKRELRRRRSAAAVRWLYAIRTTAVLIVGLMVAQPVLSLRTETNRPAPILVVADSSDSMRFTDTFSNTRLLDIAAVVDEQVERNLHPQQMQRFLEKSQTPLAETAGVFRNIHIQLEEGLPWGESFNQSLTEQGRILGQFQSELLEHRQELNRLEAGVRKEHAEHETPHPAPALFTALDRLGQTTRRLLVSLQVEERDSAAIEALTQQAQSIQDEVAAAIPLLATLQNELDSARWETLDGQSRKRLEAIAERPRIELVRAAVERLASASQLPLIQPDWGAVSNQSMPGTDLYAQLDAALAKQPASMQISGVVLLSDGGQNLPTSPGVMRRLAQRGIPLHTIGVGREEVIADVAITDYRIPGIVRARQEVSLQLALKTEVPAESDIIVRVTAGQEELLRRPFKTEGQPALSIDLEFRAPPEDLGPWTITASLAEPDKTPQNDSVRLPVQVVGKELNVLLIAQAPRWDLVYLTRILGELPVDLDTVYWGGRPAGEEVKRGSSSGRIPDSVTRLNRYGLIIIDGPAFPGWTDEDPALFRGYVEQGGSLLLCADVQGDSTFSMFGDPPTPGEASALRPAVSPPLPVTSLSAAPASSLAVWRDLSPPRTFATIPSAPDRLPLLVNSEGDACFTLDFCGRGKLYRLTVSDLYRLREWSGGHFVNRLLASLSCDMLTVAVSLDERPSIYPPLPLPGGDAWIVSQADLDGWALTVKETAEVLTRPGRGVTRLRIPRNRELLWTRHGAAVAPQLLAKPIVAETLVLNLQKETLLALAEQGQGVYLDLDRIQELPAHLTIKRDIEVDFLQISLWNQTSLLLLLAVLFTVDWVLRRRCGLVL